MVGTVVERHTDAYNVDLGGPFTAVLPALAFEGVTRRNRPNLAPGDLVYARVTGASRDADPEIACTDAAGKVHRGFRRALWKHSFIKWQRHNQAQRSVYAAAASLSRTLRFGVDWRCALWTRGKFADVLGFTEMPRGAGCRVWAAAGGPGAQLQQRAGAAAAG